MILNYESDTMLLSDYLEYDKTIFFFSKRHCQQCIEAELKNINNLSNKTDILILTDVKRQKHINILNKVGNDQLKIYSTDFDYGLLDVSRYHAPFYIRVNKDFKVLNSFFPDKNRTNLTDLYFMQ